MNAAAGVGAGSVPVVPSGARPFHYPTLLIDRWRLGDGRRVTVRPVLPQDGPLEQSLVRALSADARYQRFFVPLHELPPPLLEQMTHIDYERHVAVVAETFDDEGRAQVVGEARYAVDDDGRAAEFALVVADGWRRLGLASRLLRQIGRHAARVGLKTLYGDVLSSNAAMLAMLGKLGFERRRHPGDARLVRAHIDLAKALADCLASRSRPAPRAAPRRLPLLPAF